MFDLCLYRDFKITRMNILQDLKKKEDSIHVQTGNFTRDMKIVLKTMVQMNSFTKQTDSDIENKVLLPKVKAGVGIN